MNATVVELPVPENKPSAETTCAEEFDQINESLQRREALLAVSAQRESSAARGA